MPTRYGPARHGALGDSAGEDGYATVGDQGSLEEDLQEIQVVVR